MLDAALEYLARGWGVIPLRPRTGDKPLVKWAPYQERLPTEAEVRAWWTRYPDANIAILTGRISGLAVIDVDPRHGGSSEGLPDTGFISRTGGGGTHHLYAFPDGLRLQNCVGSDGIDVRADGGYIVAPPSIHKSGNRYEWIKNTGPLGLCPRSVLERTPAPTPHKPEEENKEKWVAELLEQGAAEGTWNDSAARLAGYLVGKKVPVDIAVSMLVNWSNSFPDPFSRDELEVTVRSVYRTSRRNTKTEPFRLMPWSAYMREFGGLNIDWLVDSWFPADTIAFAVAEPGSRKTWLSFDLAVSVAMGRDFLGKFRVRDSGPVVIVQQEDFNAQTAERLSLIAMAKNGGFGDEESISLVPNLLIHLHPDRNFRFEDPECIAELERKIAEIRPKLVIFDPLYAAVEIEDYAMKAAKSMFVLKNLRDRYHCSFFVAHHTKKANSGTTARSDAWGSQFINAFMETGWQIRAVHGKGNEVVLRRHFKMAGPQEPVHLTFDIDTFHPMRYDIVSRAISSEEADALMEAPRKGKEKGDEDMLKRILHEDP